MRVLSELALQRVFLPPQGGHFVLRQSEHRFDFGHFLPQPLDLQEIKKHDDSGEE